MNSYALFTLFATISIITANSDYDNNNNSLKAWSSNNWEEDVEDNFRDFGNDVGEWAKNFGEDVRDHWEEGVADNFRDFGNEVGSWAQHFGKDVRDWASNLVQHESDANLANNENWVACTPTGALSALSRGDRISPEEVCQRDFGIQGHLTPYKCTLGARYACCNSNQESFTNMLLGLGRCEKMNTNDDRNLQEQTDPKSSALRGGHSRTTESSSGYSRSLACKAWPASPWC